MCNIHLLYIRYKSNTRVIINAYESFFQYRNSLPQLGIVKILMCILAKSSPVPPMI